MTPAEAAEFLRLSPDTLRQWRHLRKGPKYLKLGSKVMYRKCEIILWLDEISVAPKKC
ncbi:MAG: helix-turn-helix domain-containing protein [Nitrospinaceae bacterium]|nr:helix-turn-helix domain-containing protein [Nitrospinaceae bacterium]